MLKEKNIRIRYKISKIQIVILFLVFLSFMFTLSTISVNANENTTMPNGEKYEDGWIRPQSCLHDETLIKARIQGSDYSETMRAFLNNIQQNDTLGIGKPIKDLIHYNLDDKDPQAFNHTTSALINLAINHINQNTGKAVGVYSDGTINTKYKTTLETISYRGHELNPKYVYGPSKEPARFPNVAWNPAKNIRVINPKITQHPDTNLPQNLVNVLPNATLEERIPADAYPAPNSNGVIVVNIPYNTNNFANINLQSPNKGINLLAVNYSLYNKAPYIHLHTLQDYVNTHRNNIQKIIFPSKDAYTHIKQIATFLNIDESKIHIPAPYKNNNLKNLNPTDASAKILNDIYPNTSNDIYNTLDTIFISKQPFSNNNQESLGWESDFLAALSLAVNKPTGKQAIALVNAIDNPDSPTDPITADLKNTIKRLAPGNVFISGGPRAIAMPITEKILGTLSRTEKPKWLDINSPECRHDNPKLELKKTLLNTTNNEEKVDINQIVKYQIQITNKAESGIGRNITIVEKALEGLELINYKIDNTSYSINNNKANIAIAELAPQETKNIIVDAIVKRSPNNQSINISYIQNKPPIEKQNCTENDKTCSLVTNLQKTPKLKITKTLNNERSKVNLGEEIEYNITVTNTGDGQTDSEVKIFDTPIVGLKNLDNNVFNIGILQSGESKTVKVKATTTENVSKISKNLTNTCFSSSCAAKQKCEIGDSTCTTHTSEHNIPELSLTKTHDNTKPVQENTDTFFNITISNTSNYPAQNVLVEDLPIKNLTKTEFIEVSNGSIKNNQWVIPTIAPNETYTAKVKANVTNADNFENNACVQAQYVEKFCVNNKYKDNSLIKVTKELINDHKNNQEAKYKITVTNIGTTNSRNLILKDKMTIQTIKPNSNILIEPYLGKYEFEHIDQGILNEDKKNWIIGAISPNQTLTAIVKVYDAPSDLNPNSRIINEIFPIDYPNCNIEKHRQECASTTLGGIKVTKKIIDEEKNNIKNTNVENNNVENNNPISNNENNERNISKENTTETTRKILSKGKIKFSVELENLSHANSYNVNTIDIGGQNIENPVFINTQIGKIKNNQWTIDVLPAGQKVTAIVEATVSDNTYIAEQKLDNTVFTSSKLFFTNQKIGISYTSSNNEEVVCEKNTHYCSTVTLKENSNLKIHKTLLEKGMKTYDGKYTWNIQIKNAGNTTANNIKVYEILSPQIKDIEWIDNPNINTLPPGKIENIKVITTISNPHMLNGNIQNKAIIEADNYKPIIPENQKNENSNNSISENAISYICEDNIDIDSDNDRCDIAKEEQSNIIYSNLANTGFTQKIILYISILTLGGIILKSRIKNKNKYTK